jgi:hypothetical protein
LSVNVRVPFSSAKKDDKDFFFELTPTKPEPQTYDRKSIKPVKLDEPLKTVFGFAQVLVDQKKVKGK